VKFSSSMTATAAARSTPPRSEGVLLIRIPCLLCLAPYVMAVVDVTEFGSLCYDLGYCIGSEEEKKLLLQLLDTDGDGTVSFREFQVRANSCCAFLAYSCNLFCSTAAYSCN